MLKSESLQAFTERSDDSGLFGYLAKPSASIAMLPQGPVSRQRLSSGSSNSNTTIRLASTESKSTDGGLTTSTSPSSESTLTLSTFLKLDNETSNSSSSYDVIDFLSEPIPNVAGNVVNNFPRAFSMTSIDHASASGSFQFPSSSQLDSPDNFLTYDAGSHLGVQDPLGEFGNVLTTDQENLEGEFCESNASSSSISFQSQAHERHPPARGPKSLIEEHASSSNSLVFNHLKVLLSELNIPDNDSPKYHVTWAFDPPFSKPKPSVAFDAIALEVEQIRTRRTMLGEDLKARINKLRRSTITNKKLRSCSSYAPSTPFWSIIRPVKASTLVNAITVCRRMSGAKSV